MGVVVKREWITFDVSVLAQRPKTLQQYRWELEILVWHTPPTFSTAYRNHKQPHCRERVKTRQSFGPCNPGASYKTRGYYLLLQTLLWRGASFVTTGNDGEKLLLLSVLQRREKAFREMISFDKNAALGDRLWRCTCWVVLPRRTEECPHPNSASSFSGEMVKEWMFTRMFTFLQKASIRFLMSRPLKKSTEKTDRTAWSLFF